MNRVSLIGVIGFKETKVLSNGTKLTKLSIAHKETYKDKEGVKQDKTTWINVKSFQKLAEIMEQYADVGSLVLVEGKLQVNKFTDKDGKDTSLMEVLVNEFKVLKKSDKSTSPQAENRGNLKEPGFLDDDIPW